MKRKTYALLIISTLLMLTLKVFAQCDKPLLSQLSSSDAKDRMNLFSQKKHKIFKKSYVKHISMTVSKKDISDVLRNFRNGSDYDGARISFLVYPKYLDSSRIAFAIIPTRPGTERDCNGITKSIDDTLNIYLLKNGTFIKVSSPFEMESVREGESNYNNIINHVLTDLKIRETKSIWYSKEMLFSFSKSDSFDILSYLDNCAEVDRIRINLGCWKTNPHTNSSCESYVNKTDIIFELLKSGQSKGNFFTLGGEEAEKTYNMYKKLTKKGYTLFDNWDKLPAEFSDTGLPCPPNKCK